jgi:acetyl-CoA carboxylase carboxyltransferase component
MAPKQQISNRATPARPKLKEEDIYGIIPEDSSKQYDMMEVIKRLVDNSEENSTKSYMASLSSVAMRV